MDVCESCGNRYAHPLRVRIDGAEHIFDCFECAIHALAPRCSNCGVRVLGHGVEVNNTIYCSAHCGRTKGERSLCDHVSLPPENPQWTF